MWIPAAAIRRPMPPTPIQTFRVKLPDGDVLGVLSEARIKKLIRSGVIGPDAMLQRVGSQMLSMRQPIIVKLTTSLALKS